MKARLCVQGCAQTHGIDYCTIRLFVPPNVPLRCVPSRPSPPATACECKGGTLWRRTSRANYSQAK
eukprot:5980933-Pleurochrysis_carterae.AAC.1